VIPVRIADEEQPTGRRLPDWAGQVLSSCREFVVGGLRIDDPDGQVPVPERVAMSASR
jgi:hypothetical protein